MRRASRWILGVALASACGTMWVRGRDALMTEAELRAAIPPHLRYIPPTAKEAKVEAALQQLNLDVYAEPDLVSPMRRPKEPEAHLAAMRTLFRSSEKVLDRIDAVSRMGLPAVEVDLTEPHFKYLAFWYLYRLLYDRSRPPNVPTSHDALSFAKLLRMDLLRRGGRNTSTFGQEISVGLGYFNNTLNSLTLSPAECRKVLKILPTNEEVLRVQEDQLRYDFESSVAANLGPVRAHGLIHRSDYREGDYRRYIIGRLDVPATLRQELLRADGALTYLCTGKRVPAAERATKERYGFLGQIPWKKTGESDSSHRMREIQFRIQLAFHSNPRGALVMLNGWSCAGEWARHERTWLALTRARLHIMGKVPGPLPMDPFGAGPVQYDSTRGIVWSVGRNGTDEGGKRTMISGEPDSVLDHPG